VAETFLLGYWKGRSHDAFVSMTVRQQVGYGRWLWLL